MDELDRTMAAIAAMPRLVPDWIEADQLAMDWMRKQTPHDPGMGVPSMVPSMRGIPIHLKRELPPGTIRFVTQVRVKVDQVEGEADG